MPSDQAIRGEARAAEPSFELAPDIDRSILVLYLILIVIGLIMVSSASIGIADQLTGDPFYYTKRQFLRILLSLVVVWFSCRVPLAFWNKNGMLLMLGTIILLAFVLIPGIGYTVNGSTRWLNFGVFTLQVSEVAKLFLIIYLSGYLVRRAQELQTNTMGFIKPMLVMAFASGLLILEPDFGAAAV
ncbi:MAG: FtsW/RodA/SpoVE family cell cycle protein, partial [Gammaproteobacteria bacterium]